MSCSIYIICEGDDGPIKIGVSANPFSRLRELQTGNPRKLRLVWQHSFVTRHEALAAEAEAHTFIGDCSLNGEWFDFDPRLSVAAVLACIPGDR